MSIDLSKTINNLNSNVSATHNSEGNVIDKMKRHEIIEGVTVSVNYADFLHQTLSENLHHFDHFVVVTSYDDKATQRVCQEHSVTCVPTDVMFEDGVIDGKQHFNKGKAINLGLGHTRGGGWLVHLDADIVLPDRFRTMLEKAHISPDSIYGADRRLVVGWDRWQQIRTNQDRQFHHHFLVDTEADLPIGSRLLHDDFGWTPIGYFQMWHSSRNVRYPINQGSAEHTDVLFALNWSRTKRILLPQFFVYHLESEAAPMGTNWKGRKTMPFTAAAAAAAKKP